MTRGAPISSFLEATPVVAQPVFLGRYFLGCEVASGGMATLHLTVAADSTFVARPLALKRIHAHLAAEPSFVEMFIDEARIASRLNHPNICGVLDFGEVEGAYFMTMEYLLGEPLSQLLSTLTQRPDPALSTRVERIAAQIVADACEGLHAAHELRDDDGSPLHVVHRDVSPSNLFVTYDGLTRVVDFGVAFAANRIHHTAPGNLKGKVGYMSPEQLRGNAVDRRADIWALGVVLWETIALRRLFRRETPTGTILATLGGEVPPLREVAPGVDPPLAAIVERALAADPAARYRTALAMAGDLQSFLAATGAPSARAEVKALVRETFPTGEAEKRRVVREFVDGWRSAKRCPPSGTYPSVSPRGLACSDEPTKSEATDEPRAERSAPLRRPRRVGAFAAVGLVASLAAGSALWQLRDAVVGLREVAEGLSTLRAPPSSASPPGAPTSGTVPDSAEGPRRFGTVGVTTLGGAAHVYHRGRPLGPTPGRFTLPSGPQVLSLRPTEGGAVRTVRVVVRAGETVHVVEGLPSVER